MNDAEVTTEGGTLGKSATLDKVYGYLLSSMYQIVGDSKVYLDYNSKNKFAIDVEKPLYLGEYRDNSTSRYQEVHGNHDSKNYYNDIIKYGFKPADFWNLNDWNEYNHDTSFNAFVIDGEVDSQIPITYDDGSNLAYFTNGLNLICLPKVAFTIYMENGTNGKPLEMYNLAAWIKRNGYDVGALADPEYDVSTTQALDKDGNVIRKMTCYALMLPTDNADNNGFMLGFTEDGSNINYVDSYTFDGQLEFGKEIKAIASKEVVSVTFVREPSTDFTPMKAAQYVGILKQDGNIIPFGTNNSNNFTSIYIDTTKEISVENVKGYPSVTSKNTLSGYINNALNIGAYSAQYGFADGSSAVFQSEGYLVTTKDTTVKLSVVDNNINLPISRLPVLMCAFNYEDFDETKPYIYATKYNEADGAIEQNGVLISNYEELVAGRQPMLQVVGENGKNITSNDSFTLRIFCSATLASSPDYTIYTGDIDDETYVYEITLSPTDLNEDVTHTYTKL